MSTISKILGKSCPTTGTLVYTVPTGKQAQGEISIANISAIDRKFKLALLSSGATTPTNADYIFFDTPISFGGAITRLFSMGAGESVWINVTDASTLAFVVHGLEVTP